MALSHNTREIDNCKSVTGAPGIILFTTALFCWMQSVVCVVELTTTIYHCAVMLPAVRRMRSGTNHHHLPLRSSVINKFARVLKQMDY